jgi:predicted O-methyltransferase YrrM
VISDIIREADAIDGWMSIKELVWLAETASQSNVIVELGSWKGRSTKALAMATPGIVYAVDHWRGSSNERSGPHKEASDLGSSAFFEVFKQNLIQEIVLGKLVPVMEDSTVAVQKIMSVLGARTIDLLFIDAEHTYQSVKRDIQNYLPLVSVGGIISGHDYSTAFPDIMKVVDELFGKDCKKHDSIWYHEVI